MKGQLILAFRSKILGLLRLDNLLADCITSWTDFYDKNVKSLLMSSPTFHYYLIFIQLEFLLNVQLEVLF